MTTRQEKRAYRVALVRNLEDLETIHCRPCTIREENSQISVEKTCGLCPIYREIRTIGELLSPATNDICGDLGLTVPIYEEKRKQGMTDKQIADELMVNPSSVKNWKIKNKLTNGQPKFNMSIEKYIKMCEKGMTNKEIAIKLNCSIQTLRRWRVDNHVTDIKRGGKVED